MKREIITTADGSTTIHLPELNEHYHSTNGAVEEARHVFIKHGFEYIREQGYYETLDVLEIGFGTGLNALITLLVSDKESQDVSYRGIEAYPVSKEELGLMNYPSLLGEEDVNSFYESIHKALWEKEIRILPSFCLTKNKQFFEEITLQNTTDLIYFDAFGARVQPELWTSEIFQKMYTALRDNGVLVTYSAKGSVRRAMQEVGFIVERLPGPPGKREMLRAIKKPH